MSDKCQCGKVCYTKREAQGVVNSARRPCNYFSKHGVKVHVKRWKIAPVRIYECPLCSYWHVTSEEKRGKNARFNKR